jgi:diaminohydroxyphosphoribosylaminopyrimidine deaminase/5-amino-6-(5-phosphoribosylamino)uracil reductase
VQNPADDRRWLSLAIALSERCPPSTTAFSVGAVIVDEHDEEISRGFSREYPHAHAEQAALGKLDADDGRLRAATLYSSLEPCTRRRSHDRTCSELIIAAGIKRVVIAWREPPTFVHDAHGFEALQASGVEVVEYADLAQAAAAVNAKLLTRTGG